MLPRSPGIYGTETRTFITLGSRERPTRLAVIFLGRSKELGCQVSWRVKIHGLEIQGAIWIVSFGLPSRYLYASTGVASGKREPIPRLLDSLHGEKIAPQGQSACTYSMSGGYRNLIWVFEKIAGDICEDSAFHVHHAAKRRVISLNTLYETSRSGCTMTGQATDRVNIETKENKAAEYEAAEATEAEAAQGFDLEAAEAEVAENEVSKIEAIEAEGAKVKSAIAGAAQAEEALGAFEAAEAEVAELEPAKIEAIEAEGAEAEAANEAEHAQPMFSPSPPSPSSVSLPSSASSCSPTPQRIIRGHIDIYDQISNRDAHGPITCIHCGLRVGVYRYAPHLDKCMVGNRRSSSYNRSIGNSGSGDGNEDNGGNIPPPSPADIHEAPASSSVPKNGTYRVIESPPPIIPQGGQLGMMPKFISYNAT